MPWKETCAVDQRARFVLDVERGEFTMSELCVAYGISRKTGYKWRSRYDSEGVEGLQDRSRARHHQPHEVSEAVRALVIEARRRHPTWGPKKLRPWLHRRHPGADLPSLSTMYTILKEAKLIRPQRRRRHPMVGVQGVLGGEDRPNGVWCADFKGQFRLGDGAYCYPLTVSDGCSRMLLGCRAHHGTQREPVRQAFIRLFRTYGVPEAIRSDNGRPFAANGPARLSRLSVWWMDLGISLQRITPGRPQENGRHERLHRTLKAETARPPARSHRAQQRRFDVFRVRYNWDRPHEALGQRCPGEVYEPSSCAYRPHGVAYEYPGHYEQRLVSGSGMMSWKQRVVFVSHALSGRRVGLVEVEAEVWKLYYREQALGLLDVRDRRRPHVRPLPTPDGPAS